MDNKDLKTYKVFKLKQCHLLIILHKMTYY